MWEQVKSASLRTLAPTPQTIVIGDSRAKAGFRPNKDFHDLNLSLGGGTPVEGYYTLKRYLKNNLPPQNLVISYISGHLSGGSLFWKRTIPFGYLSDDEAHEVLKLGRTFGSEIFTNSDIQLNDFNSPIAYSGNFKSGLIKFRWITNIKTLKYLESNNGHHFFGTNSFSNGISGDAYNKTFNPDETTNQYLRKMLSLAQKHNINVYFYFMPVNKSTFEKVNFLFVERFENYILDLQTQHNIKVCNRYFYMTNDHFGDPSHLYRGALENTKKVYDCVAMKD